jgi:hypothetical protein
MTPSNYHDLWHKVGTVQKYSKLKYIIKNIIVRAAA